MKTTRNKTSPAALVLCEPWEADGKLRAAKEKPRTRIPVVILDTFGVPVYRQNV